jgi:YidC/Oxa1 family membrane protein insertase
MGFFEPFAGLLAAFYAVIPSYGLAIILMTLVTRIVLLPLSIKSTRSMREMQVIQPEIKRLQKKYKGDRQKLNVEMMALYKEHGVNPFGGCLPLLLQMPVFIALFQVIQRPRAYLVPWDDSALYTALDNAGSALDVHNFFGLRLDCSVTNAFSTQGLNESPVANISEACGTGALDALPYIALILLMAGATYYQQRQMTAARAGTAQDPQAQQMQTFMKVMPLILLVFGLGFPAGVVLYWVTTNAWTIVQQRIMLKAAPPVQVTSGKAKSTTGKSSAAKTSAGKAKASTDGKAAKKTTGKTTSGKPSAKSPAGKTTPTGAPGTRNSSKKKKKR